MKNRIVRFFGMIIKQEHPIRYLISRLFVNLPFLFERMSFRRRKYKLLMSPNSLAASFYVYKDCYEVYDEMLLGRLVNKGDFFVDVGANIGHLSLALVTEKQCFGVSIEANPKTFKYLCGNIKLNDKQPHILCLNFAAGSSDNNYVDIQDSFRDDCNAVIDLNLSPLSSRVFTVQDNGLFSVACRTLDSLAVEYRFPARVRLLKVDVEGYELYVFKGAIELLKRTELIYFECWDPLMGKYGYSKHDLFDLIEAMGFKLYYPKSLEEVNKDFIEGLAPLDRSKLPSENINILGINLNLLGDNR
jgi:FkbM family methyltransferase